MAHYLVTHTSLVEAKDETGAAEQALVTLSSPGPVTLMVTLDNETFTKVVVDRRDASEPGSPSPAPCLDHPNEGDKTDERGEAPIGTATSGPSFIVDAASKLERSRSAGYVAAGSLGFCLAFLLSFAFGHL